MTEQISNHNRHSAQWYFVIKTLSSTKLVVKDGVYGGIEKKKKKLQISN